MLFSMIRMLWQKRLLLLVINGILKKAQEFDKKLFERSVLIDLELSFNQITLELFDEISTLKPFGVGNPEPVFMTKGVNVISVNKVGKEGNHYELVTLSVIA